MKSDVSFCEKVPDGYVFTVSEEVIRQLGERSEYAVTFVQLDEKVDIKAADLKKMLADPSKRSTIEGKASKAGPNRIKVVTSTAVSIDLSRLHAAYWGLGDQRLQDILAGRRSASDSCGMCYGVEGYREVTCTDPNSIVCCVACG